MQPSPLLNMAAKDFPHKFIEKIISGMGNVYKESKAKVFNDPHYDLTDKNYLLPHIRRVHTEILLRREAESAGIKVSIEKTLSGAHEYALMQTGRFSFTVCYVHSSKAFPRNATHRMQYSGVNKFLPQMDLDLIDSNVSIIPSQGEIYAILLHGSDSIADESPSFLRFGFPKYNVSAFEDFIDIYDLQEKQFRNLKSIEDEVSNSKAQPEFKRKPKEEEGT